MFVDHIKVYAKAGDGGNGCTSFRREKYVPKGGPDGGDGGKGADIILKVDTHTSNLKEFFYKPNQKAANGVQGKGRRKTGKSGKNLVIKVPPGTSVYKIPDALLCDNKKEIKFSKKPESSYLKKKKEEQIIKSDDNLVIDLINVGDEFILCKGGKGGKGNWNFRTDTNQAPLEHTMGEKGEEGNYYFELKQIADIGLIGFPNAGKSTLLNCLSNATPKIASYPFTTLKPVIGILNSSTYDKVSIADIPGLIEGAHNNIGLGHDFLRHISRCKVFLFVLDIPGVDQRDAVMDLQILRKEINLYDDQLSKRKWIIVANKMDLEEFNEKLQHIKNNFSKQEIIAISAKQRDGINYLKKRLIELSKEL